MMYHVFKIRTSRHIFKHMQFYVKYIGKEAILNPKTTKLSDVFFNIDSMILRTDTILGQLENWKRRKRALKHKS